MECVQCMVYVEHLNDRRLRRQEEDWEMKRLIGDAYCFFAGYQVLKKVISSIPFYQDSHYFS